ncbi:MAG: hypothetical protein J6R79_02305 [Bacteroidaceae bacterium]|nr:hypothetical protein [Bacteroidaceae bacterium]
MNNSYKNWLKGGLLSVFAAVGFAACSDDHFDVVVNSEAEGKTLWQNIQNNENLSDFAYILENTTFYRDKMDVVKDSGIVKMTYAEYLNKPQALTVWAPVNGTFGTEWKNKLDAIKLMYAEDPIKATAAEFKFAEQYIRQHIARFSFESGYEAQEVRLLNAKLVKYNPTERAFDGVSYDANNPSVACSNGTLHCLVAPVAYKFNLFDFLENDNRFTALYSVLSDSLYDITVFDPNLSTPGAMNNEGKMEYVDSIYSNQNILLQNAFADIKNEDSLYVAIYPTNEAYEAAIEKLKKLFVYRDKYNYSWSNIRGDWDFTQHFSDAEKDSLARTNAEKLFFANFFMSPSSMGEAINSTRNVDDIIEYVTTNDSVIFTTRTVLYNSNKGGINPAFTAVEGSETAVEPIIASNGIIFPVNEYQINPAYSFMNREETGHQVTSTTNCSSEDMQLSDATRNDSLIAGLKGIDNIRRYVSTNPGRLFNIDFRLPALYSGAYKISAIFVPTAASKYLQEMYLLNKAGKPYDEVIKVDVSIHDDLTKNGTELAKVMNVQIPTDSVQKVVLFDKFELKHTYAGMPNGVQTFPRLKIGVSAINVGSANAPKCHALNIYKIIVEPYREESTNE